MTRIIRKAVVVVLILVGAGGAAAATAPAIVGPPIGIVLPFSPLAQVGTTTSTTGGVTTTTVGDTTTVIGGTTNPITGATTPTSTTPGTTTTGATPTIEQVVALTRTVQPGAPVSAFVVPATNRLVLTDVVITNPGATPACGASVGTSGNAATPSATGDLANTGVLCIPAQTSLTLALTTGLEFTAGQSVVLANQAVTGTSGGPLFYHLRGFLMSGA
jgi:hypothetical protein